VRVATRCRHVSGGWFDEEAEVWDATGRLVAQGRQLARVGRGRLRPTRAAADRIAALEGSRLSQPRRSNGVVVTGTPLRPDRATG
jgi:Thioesterase-like superfamily